MLEQIISRYGASAKAKLSSPAISGAPEDQLRAPMEELVGALAGLGGHLPGAVTLVGESTLSALGTRPDYAVTVGKALTGFIELKAPGKGADPRRFTDPHDKRQWQKLKSLPNLLYSDGQNFSLWRNGELVGKIVTVTGDLQTAGAKLTAPPELLERITDFLRWAPIPPASPKMLAEVSARLCRLLREEVLDELKRGTPSLTDLAREWRSLLFPEADDAQFADGYAQAVTFGLLMARAQGIPLDRGIGPAALVLRRTNTLIGSALRLLTDDPDIQAALSTATNTLTRVLHEVHWPTMSKGRADAWLYFYEDFLAIYDNALRKMTGSYYTPPEVVDAMVRLVDEALRDPALFDRAAGLASRDVTIADPAVGTGTFLLGVLRRIAGTIAEDQGAGAVGPALGAAVDRLIGFELQFGPFAVAQLRLMAEMQALMGIGAGSGANLPQPHLFVTDTLGDPFATQTQFSSLLAPIGNSRREANRVKREAPITVVIGNPPYKEKAKGRGGWVEAGSVGRAAPMDRWALPPAWGQGAHAKHLKNLYVYFWRWASWKVFGADMLETTGSAVEDRGGIVCYITVAGFLNGPGFQKMRADLRQDSSDIWVIDCSPEGHQPEVNTRIFEGVQHPVCIVLAARAMGKDRNLPARLHVRALSPGRRGAKFDELAMISLTGAGWSDGPSEWRAPFLKSVESEWAAFPPLPVLFEWSGPGVMPGRTWAIAPDQQSLTDRWVSLTKEKNLVEKEKLYHPQLRDGQVASRHIRKLVVQDLGAFKTPRVPIVNDQGPSPTSVRYGFRTLDRQWIYADARMMNDPRPVLWESASYRQVFLTSPEDRTPENGPALSLTGHIPDQHHYHGRGGRVFPLWRDAAASIPNIKMALTGHLTASLHIPVTASDMMAYVAGLLAHPAYTARFRADLVRPGLRVPVTADPVLFTKAVELGRQVIWLQTYGERFSDPAQGRPAALPRMPKGQGPTIPTAGAIPAAPLPLPDAMHHDPSTRRLHIGGGYIDNVPAAVADYQISGRSVLRQWFSYRKLDRTRPVIGDRRPPSALDRIQPDHWLPEYTDDLLNLIHVLGRLVALEPEQAALLDQVCAGPLMTAEALTAAGALAAAPLASRRMGREAAQADLFG